MLVVSVCSVWLGEGSSPGCVCIGFVCFWFCRANGTIYIWAFNCSLLRFSTKPVFCSIPHLEVPRPSKSRVFPSSEAWFSFFLVPSLSCHRAKVQFLVSVRSIANHPSVFHIPIFGWNPNPVLIPFQHSLPCRIYLWFLISLLSFLWGLGKEQE